MAKQFNTQLPKVISKANKDISTIIEQDIAKESVLLKKLVDQVLKANLDVKKQTNKRILESKRKLKELDEQIDDITEAIDLVDRETIIQQLNEMIDAKNKIFTARQEIRFFDNERLPNRLNTYNTIFHQLTTSTESLGGFEHKYRTLILQHNKELYHTQKKLTDHIINQLLSIKQNKLEQVTTSIKELQQIRQKIQSYEVVHIDQIKHSIEKEYNLIDQSLSKFYNVDSDEILNKRINHEHQENLKKLQNQKERIKQQYNQTQTDIKNQYIEYEKQVLEKFESKNKAILDKEREQTKRIEAELKDIRLNIMNAEKQQDFAKVASLMKKFEQTERLLNSKVNKKLNKESDELTKVKKDKTNQQLRDLEINHVKELYNIDYQLQLEEIQFQEAKILHKIKTDYDGLTGDLDINRQRVQTIRELLLLKGKLQRNIHNLRLELRLTELEIQKQNDYLDLDIMDTYKEILVTINDIAQKRNYILSQNINTHNIIRYEQEFRLQKAIEDIKIEQETHDIDKSILKQRNSNLIELQKEIENLNSEIIYQESMIAIAKKEHELQLIKVKSLYENERSLAEEQKERINVGIQVNDAFVKTTLQNQMLFAEQQIKCAESEYDIRLESINLTFDQEVQYASKKIDYYRQKFEYEKQKHIKDLELKLEDLNYKLLLFTDPKENKNIRHQIDELQKLHDQKLQEIEDFEQQDEQIARFQKVINDAEHRQSLALEEASLIREQTITSFQKLYDQTKARFDLLKDQDHEETKGIIPLLNSKTSQTSDERLQQAIKEADILYNERIIEPEQIIAETKLRIKHLQETDNTQAFIENKRALKLEKIEKHNENILQLEDHFHKNIKPLYKKIDVDESYKSNLPKLRKTLFQDVSSLTKDDIDKDYQIRMDKEKELHNQKTRDDALYVKEKLKSLNEDHKKTVLWIKQALTPYKKYINFASKGVQAQKKELKLEANKRLRRKLIETTKEVKEKEYI